MATDIEQGFCIAVGGTNARTAHCIDGDIVHFTSEDTPDRPQEFFAWMAQRVLQSAHEGSNWLVAGFPGPVSPDGEHVGPMANVQGMSTKMYNLKAELTIADSAVQQTLDEGFKMVAVNDGTLAAQAAASRIGEYQFDRTAALIIGTGVGAGVVERDHTMPETNVYRADDSPYEIGHIPMSDDPYDRFEDVYSGKGIDKRYNQRAEKLPPGHPAWRTEGSAVGRMSVMLALLNGVELVVPTGGVGIGASDRFGPHAQEFLKTYREYGNGPQKKFAPELRLVPPTMSQEFEMYGAAGVILDHSNRPRPPYSPISTLFDRSS
jgi:predicted NBD/HSP70 family sugar kinase